MTIPLYISSSGGAYEGVVSYSGDYVDYQANLVAGKYYTIRVYGADLNGGTLADPYLTIYNSGGQVSAAVDDSTGYGHDIAIKFGPVNTTGSYDFRVSGDGGAAGTYTFSLYPADGSGSVPYYIASTGGRATGSVQSIDETSMFESSLTAGKTYHITVFGVDHKGGTLTDPQMFIKNPNGNISVINHQGAETSLITESWGYGHDISMDFVPYYTGTYSFGVQGQNGAIGTFSFGISSAGLTGTSGNDVIDGSSGNVTVNGGTGIDTVRVTAPKSDCTVVINSDDTVTLTLANGAKDTLINIQSIQFSDGTVDVDDAAYGKDTIYRFFNTKTGTHFYSSSLREAEYVNQNWAGTYSNEGAAFQTSLPTDDSKYSDVFRFYNTLTGTHFYTISETERDQVIARYPQYQYEGAAFIAMKAPDPGADPIYRFFNTSTGTHFYTANEAEKLQVIGHLPQYQYEGVAFYI